MENKEKDTQVDIEKCVFCDTSTGVPKHMHVDYRFNYVEGVGQLCDACYNKVYNKTNRGD